MHPADQTGLDVPTFSPHDHLRGACGLADSLAVRPPMITDDGLTDGKGTARLPVKFGTSFYKRSERFVMSESELPLTFTEGRGRNVGFLVIAVVLTVGSLLAVIDDGPVWMWAGVVLFGLGIPLFVWSIFNPQKLVVDDEGVTATSPPNKTTHVPWDVVEHFKVNEVNVPTGRAGRMVAFDFLDGAHQRHPDVVSGLVGQQMAQSVAGAHGAFPSTSCYGEDPDELVALLERVRVDKNGQ